jgi:hypothetical protein
MIKNRCLLLSVPRWEMSVEGNGRGPCSANWSSGGLPRPAPAPQACTGIQLIAKDGGVVAARTLEFGIDLRSDVLVVPAGARMSGFMPDGSKGIGYTTKYGMAGANGFGLPSSMASTIRASTCEWNGRRYRSLTIVAREIRGPLVGSPFLRFEEPRRPLCRERGERTCGSLIARSPA